MLAMANFALLHERIPARRPVRAGAGYARVRVAVVIGEHPCQASFVRALGAVAGAQLGDGRGLALGAELFARYPGAAALSALARLFPL